MIPQACRRGRGSQSYDDMKDVAAEFAKLRFPSEIDIENADVEVVEAMLPEQRRDALVKKLESTMCNKDASIVWGMAPNKVWIGQEDYLRPCIRLQTRGFRVCTYMRYMAARAIISPHANHVKMVYDALEGATPEDVKSLVDQLGAGEVP